MTSRRDMAYAGWPTPSTAVAVCRGVCVFCYGGVLVPFLIAHDFRVSFLVLSASRALPSAPVLSPL